ncbi:MAG: molybdopterin-dependent oxidoreductase [Actinomycetes bacterium]
MRSTERTPAGPSAVLRPRAVLALVLCVGALVAAGCSKSETASTTTAAGKATTTSNPYGAGEVDPPGPTDVVLKVTGPSGSKEFTMTELTALGTREVTINEPFVKRTIAFTGVPMKAIFDTVGIAGPVRVRTAALNDYVYDKSTAQEFVDGDGLIAVAQEGRPVDIDQGGPVRIIFPNDSKMATNLDAWNWSLAEMSVKGS